MDESMKEKWKLTLDLLKDLKTLDEDQRKEWKREVIKQVPEMENYVNAALKVVEG